MFCFSFYELFFYQKTYKQNTTILYDQCQSEAICFANILHVLCNLKSILLIDELHSPLMQLTYMYGFFKYYNSRKYINLMEPALQTLKNLSFVLVNGRGSSYFFEKKEKNCHIYTIGKTGHINEPNSISPNCSGDSTHFRLFFNQCHLISRNHGKMEI